MFKAQHALFFYCVSPVHMGAGTAIGLIDNPIQRERHTEHPMLAGSGLKGAVRHRFQADGWSGDDLDTVFGPLNSDFAGAVAFGDAQLVAFPVRCAKNAYVYATSRVALARARRMLEHLGIQADWEVPDLGESECRVPPGSTLAENDKLYLEAFEYAVADDPGVGRVADWLASEALPESDAYDFFRNKLKTDLVLMEDEDFTYFVKHATVVEPHVRINDETGAADDHGLFYTENLPPESILLAPVMASDGRGSGDRMDAEDVLEKILLGPDTGDNIEGLDGLLVQIGGDTTTGRGQVVVKAVYGGTNDDDNT